MEAERGESADTRAKIKDESKLAEIRSRRAELQKKLQALDTAGEFVGACTHGGGGGGGGGGHEAGRNQREAAAWEKDERGEEEEEERQRSVADAAPESQEVALKHQLYTMNPKP